MASPRARFDWPHDRCILCLRPEPLTEEHIITGYLGGRLQVKFLCERCNSTVGSREAALKSDPSIRLAVEHLKSQIPEIAAALTDGQPFFATSARGNVRGIVKGERFRASASRETDGSLIQPTPAGRKTIAAWLSEQYDTAEAERLLREFDEAPDDTEIDLGAVRAIKWSHDDPRPALTGSLVDEVPILKAAYEFLACHLMGSIYHPRFDDVRAAILGEPHRADAYTIERLRGDRYAPMHGLALEAGMPHIVVQVRFFRWLAFRVHVLDVAWGGLRYVHTLDLTSGAGYCTRIPEKGVASASEKTEPAPPEPVADGNR
jgi:hypothetical protein